MKLVTYERLILYIEKLGRQRHQAVKQGHQVQHVPAVSAYA